MISYGITKYSSDYSLGLKSSWLDTTRLLPIPVEVALAQKSIAVEMLMAIQQYYETEMTSKKNLASEIKYMLSNDVPVTLSIGPTYESYDKVGETESIFSLGSIKAVLFYKLDGTYEKPYRLITDYEYPVNSHYVTVTGIIMCSAI